MMSDIFYGLVAVLGIAAITGIAILAFLLLFFDYGGET